MRRFASDRAVELASGHFAMEQWRKERAAEREIQVAMKQDSVAQVILGVEVE